MSGRVTLYASVDKAGAVGLTSSKRREAAWSDLLEIVPHGIAVLDSARRFVHVNSAAAALCGFPADELLGRQAPFLLPGRLLAKTKGVLDDGGFEHVCTWAAKSCEQLEFAYRTRPMPADKHRTVVAFRDITVERHRQRRVTALARSSVRLGSKGSIMATLDALALEMFKADALAGVQILTLDNSGENLQVMGSAGFTRWPDFFDRLMQCRENGATLRMLEALELRKPIVIPDRWAAIQLDAAWTPLHEYLSELRWGWFASVPLIIRGRATGVLNAFLAPDQVVGHTTLEFLLAMAEQTAVAVDYASLLLNERQIAGRDERQHLARDLHDSIVQQVFSTGMQAKSLEVLGARGDTAGAEDVRRIAQEVGAVTRTVLSDLRAIINQLRPAAVTQLGLEGAIQALIDSTTNRTGIRFSFLVGPGLGELAPAITEDLFHIVAEAIHHVVRHAEARRITLGLGVRDNVVKVRISDNGNGGPAVGNAGQRQRGDGHGLTAMRERAERWGGAFKIQSGPRKTGTAVTVTVPLVAHVPTTTQDQKSSQT